ncbi:VOC family protein [Rhodopila sp.]|uniref:VOC family protein n=1 Tax=Rhodopila sp. TaxID=2480087 RepID=UPI003D0D2653
MSSATDITSDNVAMSVTDIDSSADWYGRGFGFTPEHRAVIEPLQADLLILRRPGLQVELFSRRGTPRAPDMIPGSHLDASGLKAIVIRFDDIGAVTSYSEGEQAILAWKLQPLSLDGLRSTMMRDPDGRLINVLCYSAAAGCNPIHGGVRCC